MSDVFIDLSLICSFFAKSSAETHKVHGNKNRTIQEQSPGLKKHKIQKSLEVDIELASSTVIGLHS